MRLLVADLLGATAHDPTGDRKPKPPDRRSRVI
jgi:hypothetical protein